MNRRNSQPPRVVPPEDPADWELLARYLAGEASAGDVAAVRAWRAADPVRAELLTALRPPIERLRRPAPADLDVEAALRRVHERLDRPADPAPVAYTPGRARVLAALRWNGALLPTLRAAAVLALLAGGALLARHFLRRPEGEPSLTAAARVYRTGVGQRDSVLLADGTRVLLGPGTTLTVAAGYPARRELALTGEALFEVRHDPAHPVILRAGGAVIQDVGTVFDVRSDVAGRVRVVVTSGAVRLSPIGNAAAGGVVLHARDVGVLEAGRVVARHDAGSAEALAWTRGQLVFQAAPLTEVAAALRRWYGVELRIDDAALARQHLTTSFEGDSRERVLDVIALALGGRIELHGDTAILVPSRAGAR